MAAGGSSDAAGLDVPAAAAVEARIAQRGVSAGAAHAGLLRDVLALHSIHTSAGMGLMTAAQVALNLRCSEWRAQRLLAEATGLSELPGALVGPRRPRRLAAAARWLTMSSSALPELTALPASSSALVSVTERQQYRPHGMVVHRDRVPPTGQPGRRGEGAPRHGRVRR